MATLAGKATPLSTENKIKSIEVQHRSKISRTERDTGEAFDALSCVSPRFLAGDGLSAAGVEV